jgi:hypothetical protein
MPVTPVNFDLCSCASSLVRSSSLVVDLRHSLVELPDEVPLPVQRSLRFVVQQVHH